MNSRKLLAGLASAAMMLSLAGCSSSGGSGSDDGSSSTSNGGVSKTTSGTLIVGTTQELAGVFSPLFATTAYDMWVTNLVYESLMAYNGDSELYKQIAAEDPVLNEEGNAVTFKLKEGLKFSDGTTLDANDVKFTFTLMADPSYIGERNDGTYNFIEGWKEYQEGDATEVTGIVVEDPTTVTFKFATPNIDAVDSIATFAIMSDEQFPYTKGDLGQYKTDTSDIIGSNGYMINSYDKSAGASLVKNPEYTNDGVFNIERVIIKTIGASTELASLENGDINYLPETIEATIVGPASLVEGLTYDYYFRSAEGYIGFNCADGPTADPAVRQALSYATDRASFVKAFYAFPTCSDDIKDVGLGYVPTAFWSPVATDMGEYTTGAADLEGLVAYDFDLDKAIQTLEDAGWVEGSSTNDMGVPIREKDGQKLTVKFVATKDNSVLDTLTPMIIDSWSKIGVDLKQTQVDFNTLISTVEPANKDVSAWSCFFMATSFTGLSNTSMNDLLGYTGSVDNPTYLGNNYVRIVNEELNNDLTAGKETTDREASLESYKKAMVEESNLAPYLPIYGNHLFNIYATNVKDVKTGPVCNWSQALNGATVE